MTKNEEFLLKIISDNDFIFTENLKSLFDHKSYRYLIINRLETKGLIVSHKLNSRRSIWVLTDLGKSFAKKLFPYFFSNFEIDNLPDYNINHSSKLIDIQILILKNHQKFNNISIFYSEKLITKYFNKYSNDIKKNSLGSKIRIPDLQFNINNHGTIALELELTLKSKARYRQIYSFYRNYNTYNHIYWVYEDESLISKVQHYFDFFRDHDQKDLNVTIPNKHKFIPLDFFKSESINFWND